MRCCAPHRGLLVAATLPLTAWSCVAVDHVRGTTSGGDNRPVVYEAPAPPEPCPAVADAAAPVVLFTDITSGPVTGGEGGLGAFVTIYGLRFGVARGSSTVKVGGQEAARYVSWADSSPYRGLAMIVVQLGPAISSGDLVVGVGPRVSNPVPFTVRAGNIYFVDPSNGSASDANLGTDPTAPLASLYAARAKMVAGDIVYISGDHDNHDPADATRRANLIIGPGKTGAANGTAELPIAYVGYPGNPGTLGGDFTNDTVADILFTADGGVSPAYHVIAGLVLNTAQEAVVLAGVGHRLIGNQLSYMATATSVARIDDGASHVQILGNRVQADGANSGGDGVLLVGSSYTDIDVGWNVFFNHGGNAAIRLEATTPGATFNGIRIHANELQQLASSAIVTTGSSADVLRGGVDIYNNLILGAVGPGLSLAPFTAPVWIRHNIIYDNGVQLGVDGEVVTFVSNNIIGDAANGHYCDGSCTLSGASNLFVGSDPPPAWDGTALAGDPQFVDPGTGDFSLAGTSPAVNGGTATNVCDDFSGRLRPQNVLYDIGAFEQ